MIGGCITSGKYNMTADLYRKSSRKDENTGQVKVIYSPQALGFPVIARGLSNLRGKDSGTMQDYGNKLDEYHFLRIKTMQKIKEGDVVMKIYDASGNIYMDGIDDNIQFVVLGVTPTYDPFGEFMEYDVLCNRAQVSIKITDVVIVSSDSTVMESI